MPKPKHEYAPKACKTCGEPFTPRGTRSLYCAKHQRADFKPYVRVRDEVIKPCRMCGVVMHLDPVKRNKIYCNVCAHERDRMGRRFRGDPSSYPDFRARKHDASNDTGEAPPLDEVPALRTGKFCGNCAGQPWRRPKNGICIGCREAFAIEPEPEQISLIHSSICGEMRIA